MRASGGQQRRLMACGPPGSGGSSSFGHDGLLKIKNSRPEFGAGVLLTRFHPIYPASRGTSHGPITGPAVRLSGYACAIVQASRSRGVLGGASWKRLSIFGRFSLSGGEALTRPGLRVGMDCPVIICRFGGLSSGGCREQINRGIEE